MYSGRAKVRGRRIRAERGLNEFSVGPDISSHGGSSGRSWWRCGRIDDEEREYQAATLARLEAMKHGEAGPPQAAQPEATAPMRDLARTSREESRAT